MNHIYLEKTENLPGFRTSGLIYNIALYILHLINKNPEALKAVKDGDGPSISSLISRVEVTYNKVDNLIRTLNEADLPPLPGKKARAITFHDLPDKKVVTSFYVKILPIHYIFMTYLVDNGYIDDIFQKDLKSIYNALNQIYANPDLLNKENPVIENLIAVDTNSKRVVYTQVGKYINDDKVLADPLQVSKLIETLFDRKVTSESSDLKAKLVYNEAIRNFDKLADFFTKIINMYNRQGDDFGLKNNNIKVLFNTVHNNLKNADKVSEKIKYFEQNKDQITKAFTEEISNFLEEYNQKVKTQPKYQDANFNTLKSKGVETVEKAKTLIDLIIARKQPEDIKRFNQIMDLLVKLNPIVEDINKNDEDIETEKMGSVKVSDQEEFKFNKLPDKFVFVRIPHKVRDANFEVPKGFDDILKITENKQLSTTGKKVIQKKLEEYGSELGEEITSAGEQRGSLGVTRVFNEMMKRIMKETDFNTGIPIISQYGDPFKSDVKRLRSFYRDSIEYLNLLKQNKIKLNEFVGFFKSNQEDITDELTRLNELESKKIKESDINNIFKSLYKSKDNKQTIDEAQKLLDLMNNTIKSYREKEEIDPSDYFSKYPGTSNPRKPFISTIPGYDPLQWHNKEKPFDKNTRFFSIGEEELIQAILQTRNLSDGGASSNDLDDIYLDFITIIRLFVNGQLKRKVGDKKVPIESLDDLTSNSIIKLLSTYRTDINKQFAQYRIEKRKESRKIATVKSSEKREKEKEAGEKEYSKADIRKFMKQRKALDKLIYISKSNDLDKLLSDYFRADYVKQNNVTKEVEFDELKQFYETYYRIIKIKTSVNDVTPNVFKKPKNDSEIKDILFKIFKNRYMSEADIALAKSIFKENESADFFNIKFFIKDFLSSKKKKVDDIGLRPKTDINLIDLPYILGDDDKKQFLLDDKSISRFIKRIYPKQPEPTTQEIQIAKLVFDQNDPPEKENEDKIDLTFFKLTYSYLLSLKGSEIELDKINKFKEIAKKQTVADIISPNSTSKYSNVLYLELTDLSKEIKFSNTTTPISMVLNPSIKEGNSGTYKIFVSKHYLDDFLKKNNYVLSDEEQNHLSNKEFLLEGSDINADKSVLVISGEYETVFKPYDGKFSLEDIYKLYYGSDQLVNPVDDLKNAKTAEEVMDAIIKNRAKVIELEKKSVRLSQKISGEKVDKITYVEDDFYNNSKRILDLFEKNIKIMITTLPTTPTKNIKNKKSQIENFKDKIENEIDKYKNLIKDYRSELNSGSGPAKLEKLQSKVKDQANSTLGLFFKFYDSYIYSFIEIISDLIKKRNRYYLNIKQTGKDNKSRYEILFDNDDKFKYKGVNSTSYESKIKIINDFFQDYSDFSISSNEFILLDIEDIQRKFVFAQEEMEDLISLIENDISDEQIISTNTADIELEHSSEKVVISKAVFVENFETGYRRVEIVKPTKYSILNTIKSKYEIK